MGLWVTIKVWYMFVPDSLYTRTCLVPPVELMVLWAVLYSRMMVKMLSLMEFLGAQTMCEASMVMEFLWQ